MLQTTTTLIMTNRTKQNNTSSKTNHAPYFMGEHKKNFKQQNIATIILLAHTNYHGGGCSIPIPIDMIIRMYENTFIHTLPLLQRLVQRLQPHLEESDPMHFGHLS